MTPLADGRHARRQRNRDSVVEALLELYREGNLDPTTDTVAQRSGVSARSLFRYFDDVDDLCRAAVEKHLARILPVAVIDIDVTKPVDERIDALVRARLRLQEAIGSVGRVARLRAPFQPVIEAELRRRRQQSRDQIAQLFAPELQGLDAATRAAIVGSLDVLCSYEGLELMLTDQLLSPGEVRIALVRAITSILVPVAALD